jgi:Bacterial capsule synthesis protein PGA_cap
MVSCFSFEQEPRPALSFFILSLGNELREWPSQSQRTQAPWLVEQGADLILAHHPDVIERPTLPGETKTDLPETHWIRKTRNENRNEEGLIADIGGKLIRPSQHTHADPGTTILRAVGSDRVGDSVLLDCGPEIKQKTR